jgi:yersiniabactin nonribosomal peptide synthetase
VFRFKYDSSSYNKIFKNGILPIGKVFDEHEFKIVDSDLKPTSDDESGHLIFKGPQVSQGYLNDITKTSDVFRNLAFDKSNDIWYLSGDLAYINDFGDVECLGRLDDQIKISGRRIELGEIEHVLMETKLLKDVVVVPIRNESNLVLQLVAFTTTELDDEIINSVIQSSLAHIEKLFLPKRIYNIKEFPLSQSGKTNRKKLEELAREIEN